MKNDTAPPLDGVYYPTITEYGVQVARLTWDAHNYIQLTVVSGDEASPEYHTLFHVAPGEVGKVISTMDSLRLTLSSNKSYRLRVVSQRAIDEWLDRLSRQGVRVVRIGYGRMFLLGLGISFALLVVIIVFVILFM